MNETRGHRAESSHLGNEQIHNDIKINNGIKKHDKGIKFSSKHQNLKID